MLDFCFDFDGDTSAFVPPRVASLFAFNTGSTCLFAFTLFDRMHVCRLVVGYYQYVRVSHLWLLVQTNTTFVTFWTSFFFHQYSFIICLTLATCFPLVVLGFSRYFRFLIESILRYILQLRNLLSEHFCFAYLLPWYSIFQYPDEFLPPMLFVSFCSSEGENLICYPSWFHSSKIRFPLSWSRFS